MAEISAAIYNLLQQPQVRPFDPLETMGQVQNLRSAQQRSAIGQLALEEAQRQRAVDDQVRAAYRRAYSQGGTTLPEAGGAAAPEAAVQETVNSPYSSELQAMLAQYQQEGADVTPTPGARTLPGAGGVPSPEVLQRTPGQPPVGRAVVGGLQRGVNQAQLVQDLYQIDPQAGMAAEKAARDSHTAQLEMLGKQNAMVSQVARSILMQDTQQAYEVGVRYLQQAGIPVDHLPPIYDRRMVEHYYAMSTDAETRLNEQKNRLAGQRLALDVETEQRLQRAEGRAETKAQREELEAAHTVPEYTGDAMLDLALDRRRQEAGIPRGTPTPAAVETQARQDVIDGKVSEAAAQGLEKARLELEDKPLDAATEKAVSEFTTLQNMTDDVSELFDPSYTGKFEGRWGAIKSWAGQTSQRQVVFQRVVKELTEQLGRARSGANIPPEEYARLEANMPQVTDSDSVFLAKLLSFRRSLDQAKKNRLETATTARGQLRKQSQEVTPLPGRQRVSRATVDKLATEEKVPRATVVQRLRAAGLDVED